jgi:hypothetical protein
LPNKNIAILGVGVSFSSRCAEDIGVFSSSSVVPPSLLLLARRSGQQLWPGWIRRLRQAPFGVPMKALGALKQMERKWKLTINNCI